MVASNGVVVVLSLIIRFYLARENKARLRQNADSAYDDVFIEVPDENGAGVKRKVDKAFLDLTDRQNNEYRYAL